MKRYIRSDELDDFKDTLNDVGNEETGELHTFNTCDKAEDYAYTYLK